MLDKIKELYKNVPERDYSEVTGIGYFETHGRKYQVIIPDDEIEFPDYETPHFHLHQEGTQYTDDISIHLEYPEYVMDYNNTMMDKQMRDDLAKFLAHKISVESNWRRLVVLWYIVHPAKEMDVEKEPDYKELLSSDEAFIAGSFFLGALYMINLCDYDGTDLPPHFHFHERGTDPSEDICIRLDTPEYFSHDGGEPNKFEDYDEVEKIVKYLKEIPKYGILNNWERLKDCWIERGSTNPVDLEEMPDYTKLPYGEFEDELD